MPSLTETMLANQPPPAAAPPAVPSRLARAMLNDDSYYDGMGPIDRLKLSMGLADKRQFTPEQQAAAAEQNTHDALSVVPGIGSAVAMKDAWDDSGHGAKALGEGRFKDAVGSYGSMLANTLGAMLPFRLPGSAAARQAAKDAPTQTNIFAGPRATTADHAALAKAREMKAAGASRGDVRQATGWDLGAVDGVPRFEIDDSAAALTGLEKGKVARFSGLDHPELEDAYGQLPPVHGLVQPTAPNSGAFMPGRPPYIAAQGRTPEAAKSVALHEFQHAAQNVEGFAMGGSPKSFAHELPTGGRDNGYETYRRLAGEVEARNVQARRNMTAAERRATPPWETQDVPDHQQLVSMRGKGPMFSINGETGMDNVFRREQGPAAPANDGGARVLPMREGIAAAPAAPTSDIGAYAKNSLSVGGDTAIPLETIYADYARRAAANGETPAPMMGFIRTLREQGLFPQHIAGKARYFATIKD